MSSVPSPPLSQRFIQVLLDQVWDGDAVAVAESIWLVDQIGKADPDLVLEVNPVVVEPLPIESEQIDLVQADPQTLPDSSETQSIADVVLPPPQLPELPEPETEAEESDDLGQKLVPAGSAIDSIPIVVPSAPGLRHSLELSRSLRSLKRRVPSMTQQVLDEEATACRMVESRAIGQEFCVPVMVPAPERWLEVALVVEESRSTFIWRDLVDEFRRLLEREGAFRDVRTWQLVHQNNEWHLQVWGVQSAQHYRTQSLIEPTRRRLILFVSDCVSAVWQQGQVQSLLAEWGKSQPLALVQLMPENLWQRTALRQGISTEIGSQLPGSVNEDLVVPSVALWLESVEKRVNQQALKLPVMALEPYSMERWAKMLAGVGNQTALGVLFENWSVGIESPSIQAEISDDDLDLIADYRSSRFERRTTMSGRNFDGPSGSGSMFSFGTEDVSDSGSDFMSDDFSAPPTSQPQSRPPLLVSDVEEKDKEKIEAEGLVRQFLLTASPLAQRLARSLTAAPVSLAVVYLIQETVLRDSWQAHAAEVFMSGLIRAVPGSEPPVHDFVPGVREVLAKSTRISDSVSVLDHLSRYFASRAGLSVSGFQALLVMREVGAEVKEQELLPLLKVMPEVLARLGGEYAEFAQAAASNLARVSAARSSENNREEELLDARNHLRVLELILRYEEAIKRKVIDQFSDDEYEYTTDMAPEEEMIDDVDTSDVSLDFNRPINMRIDYTSIKESNSEVFIDEEYEEISINGLIVEISFSVETSLIDYDYYVNGIDIDGLPTYSMNLVDQLTSITVDLVFSSTDGEFEIDATIHVEQPIVLTWDTVSENDRRMESPENPQLSTFEFEYGEYEEVDTMPQLQTFEFDVLTFASEPVDNPEPDLLAALDWQRVSFTVATTNPTQKSKLLTSSAAAWMYTAKIEVPRRMLRGNLDMKFEMMAVPGGKFSMGSNDLVIQVPPFFMGKYPVTQKLWSAVSQMPRVNRDLEPAPSKFKGGDKPVERVSWLDAMEFCARLSKNLRREYRLPTEAEWEYACRAGTITEYHFGDEITSELANYGRLKLSTTPIGQFPYVNSFGLSDMHGNVWEWCMDHWHESYKEAPLDGSAWTETKAEENAPRILRGGSWDVAPGTCRSASRDRLNAAASDVDLGFRLVSPARILLSSSTFSLSPIQI